MARQRYYRNSGLPQKYAKEYTAWNNMKRRCDSPCTDSYENYGGRGISVCRRWLGWKGFANFIEDMGQCPEGYSLDRIDVNEGYTPSNCRWIDFKTQCRNKNQNHCFWLWGEKYILKDACEIFHINHQTVCERIRKGWDEYDALVTPVMRRRKNVRKTK